MVWFGIASLYLGGAQEQTGNWIPPIRQAPRIPFPEVPRQGQEATPFDAPAVVLIAQVRHNWEIEDTDQHGKSLIPKPRSYMVQRAEIITVVRLNERKKEDPDLRKGVFVINQKDRRDNVIKFKFGQPYILFLNPAPQPAFYLDIDVSKEPYDAYVLAALQGGFEVVDGRLRPLIGGGALDAYDGRDASAVIREQFQK